MGSPLSPFVADIYMDKFVQTALQSCVHPNPFCFHCGLLQAQNIFVSNQTALTQFFPKTKNMLLFHVYSKSSYASSINGIRITYKT